MMFSRLAALPRRLKASLRAAHDRLSSISEYRLSKILLKHRYIVLIFDHGLGGGANIFTKKLIRNLTDNKQTIALKVFFDIDHRRVVCDAHTYNKLMRHYPLTLETLIKQLEQHAINKVIINDLVSWPTPVKLMSSIVGMCLYHNPELTIYFHDYFFICPSFTLLNYQDQYCKLPDLITCNSCLSNHKDRWVTSVGVNDIKFWRESSGQLLELADGIFCFSHFSASLLNIAFPNNRFRIAVTPHQLLFTPQRIPTPNFDKQLCIGVLGNIGFHKGARIIEKLAKLLVEHNVDASIVIVGNYFGPRHERITVTGKYKREDIPSIIDEHGINTFFFPSIWPETFSFVCAEIMALGMPLVAFNHGAPAERISDYSLGMLVEEVSAEAALQVLVDFYTRLREQSDISPHPSMAL